MRFGLYLPNSGPICQLDALAEIARRGDCLGFHCMVTPDHIAEPIAIKSPYRYTVGASLAEARGAKGTWEWAASSSTSGNRIWARPWNAWIGLLKR